MIVEYEIRTRRYRSDLNQGVSIAIDLDFGGPQPSHFGAAPAVCEPMRSGEFVGRTSAGGSCNVDVLKLNPHCNGTHTETVGHLVDQVVSVSTQATEAFFVAALITVEAKSSGDTLDRYDPELEESDSVIDLAELKNKASALIHEFDCEALVVRTLPNGLDKLSRRYGEDFCSPFFTIEAMEYVASTGVRHLLVDLPSIDRSNDDGKMTNHRIFWQQQNDHQLSADAKSDHTISEMIFVPDAVVDGCYLLNLQIPALITDAAPSRPMLFPVQVIHE